MGTDDTSFALFRGHNHNTLHPNSYVTSGHAPKRTHLLETTVVLELDKM